jgi:hypothetical protein
MHTMRSPRTRLPCFLTLIDDGAPDDDDVEERQESNDAPRHAGFITEYCQQ